ncbi:MAG: hypothetical protein HY088_03980 [Ignavibacteriales bacterium]|nr:hypothetical protein [Ignavibacteriales bacterium]
MFYLKRPMVGTVGTLSVLIFLTRNRKYRIISPDLSHEKPEVPASIGIFRTPEMANQPRRGVIYTIAPSYKNINVIWAGTDDGLIHITRDGGKSWKNVTPPELTSWSKVSIMDASHFDDQTAYAAINRFRLDDLKPHIYRTHDGGKTWKEIVKGLPDNAAINTVREDPIRKGLLFAGSENAVYVSFNDGDNWQSLRLNMPATSIRDLVIHDDDVVVGTHGRSFWILDDITPLRQINEQVANSDASLFKPQVAYRVRWNMNSDTPLPPEEPAGKNPPDGAIISYYLKSSVNSPVTLEIFDSSNKLVRKFSSDDKPDAINEKEFAIPMYWVRQPQILSAEAGMQRVVWDLHYPSPEGERAQFPISAIYKDTPREPRGPVVLPGNYTVKLTVNGKSFTQPLAIKMDPRVKTPKKGLEQQFSLSYQAYSGIQQAYKTLEQLRKLRSQLKELQGRASGSLADAIVALDKKAGELEGSSRFRRVGGSASVAESNFNKIRNDFSALYNVLQEADVAPTTQAVKQSSEAQKSFSDLTAQWNNLKAKELSALNSGLAKAHLPKVVME